MLYYNASNQYNSQAYLSFSNNNSRVRESTKSMLQSKQFTVFTSTDFSEQEVSIMVKLESVLVELNDVTLKYTDDCKYLQCIR